MEGVSGPLAAEEAGASLSTEADSLILTDACASFQGLDLLSFAFTNSSAAEPLDSLVRKLSSVLPACFRDGLGATGVSTLATSFLEEEEAGEMGGDSKANCNTWFLEAQETNTEGFG